MVHPYGRVFCGYLKLHSHGYGCGKTVMLDSVYYRTSVCFKKYAYRERLKDAYDRIWTEWLFPRDGLQTTFNTLFSELCVVSICSFHNIKYISLTGECRVTCLALVCGCVWKTFGDYSILRTSKSLIKKKKISKNTSQNVLRLLSLNYLWSLL